MRATPILAFALALAAGPVAAGFDVTSRTTVFPGPYAAELVKVVDGDTLDMRVAIWPGIVAEYAVRVRGIDAPETSRPACAEERAAGEAATAAVREFYGADTEIRLGAISRDSFSGRVVADVERLEGGTWVSLADELAERELAQRWTPEMADVPWCLLLSAPEGGE